MQEVRIASLHVHAAVRNEKKNPQKMQDVLFMDLVEGKGIVQDVRYFDTKNKRTGEANRNHVSIITRKEIREHQEEVHAKNEITPGQVRSNIELEGVDINLVDLQDRCDLLIGKDALIRIYKPRTPCWQMDVICPGLQANMKRARQGVIAEVIRSGRISVGDPIRRVEIKNP